MTHAAPGYHGDRGECCSHTRQPAARIGSGFLCHLWWEKKNNSECWISDMLQDFCYRNIFNFSQWHARSIKVISFFCLTFDVNEKVTDFINTAIMILSRYCCRNLQLKSMTPWKVMVKVFTFNVKSHLVTQNAGLDGQPEVAFMTLCHEGPLFIKQRLISRLEMKEGSKHWLKHPHDKHLRHLDQVLDTESNRNPPGAPTSHTSSLCRRLVVSLRITWQGKKTITGGRIRLWRLYMASGWAHVELVTHH